MPEIHVPEKSDDDPAKSGTAVLALLHLNPWTETVGSNANPPRMTLAPKTPARAFSRGAAAGLSQGREPLECEPANQQAPAGAAERPARSDARQTRTPVAPPRLSHRLAGGKAALLLILMALGITACACAPPHTTLRRAFAMAASQPVTVEAVRAAALERFPLGTEQEPVRQALPASTSSPLIAWLWPWFDWWDGPTDCSVGQVEGWIEYGATAARDENLSRSEVEEARGLCVSSTSYGSLGVRRFLFVQFLFGPGGLLDVRVVEQAAHL